MDLTACEDARTDDLVEVRKRYWLEPLDSLMGTAHAVRSKPVVHIFTAKLPWSHTDSFSVSFAKLVQHEQAAMK